MPELPPEHAGCRQPRRPGQATPGPRNPRPASPKPTGPKPTGPAPACPKPLPDPADVRLCPIPDPSPPLDDVAGGTAPRREATRSWAASPHWAASLDWGVSPDCAADDAPAEARPGRAQPAAPPPGTAQPAPPRPSRAPGGQEPAGHGLPAGAEWPSRFAQVLAETLAGSRPEHQLVPWTTERVRDRIRRLGPSLSSPQRPRVRRVVTFHPTEEAIEMTVVVGFGSQVRALAVRLERSAPPAPPGPTSPGPARGWLCTAVEAA